MAATLQNISEWFDRGVKEKATHMIVVCDSFDYSDYPVYVKKGQDVIEIQKIQDNKEMQRVIEVYNLSKNKIEQLNQTQAFNY